MLYEMSVKDNHNAGVQPPMGGGHHWRYLAENIAMDESWEPRQAFQNFTRISEVWHS